METQFKEIAGLIGEPTRATIMWALLDGKAFTATELAITADTTAQNISMHLSKLLAAGLLCVESQGRHRYYRYSRDDIAYAMEAMANLIPHPVDKHDAPVAEQSAITYCRSCYDHLAGKVGVVLTDSLLRQKIIIANNNSFDVTAKGSKWFAGLDIDVNELKKQRRALVRPCLDWSERRHHIAGALAASLLQKMLSSDWIRKTRNSRAIIITGKGQKMFNDYFKITV